MTGEVGVDEVDLAEAEAEVAAFLAETFAKDFANILAIVSTIDCSCD